MPRLTLQRPPVVASLAALVALGILLNLGLWQAKKYRAKTLYSDTICARDIAPVRTQKFTQLEDSSTSFCPGKANFTGLLDTAENFRIGPRVQNSNPGYHIYAILRSIEDGSGILVNLGWTPQETYTLPFIQKEITVQGDLIAPGKPSMLAMKNIPEREQWQTLDVEQIIEYYGFENISPHVLIASDIKPEPIKRLEPSALANSYLTPQMHLQYALFWFSMALAMLVIFTLRFVLKKKAE